MDNVICNKSEDIDLIIPYINKPVYIKGYCWGRRFNGWAVIYERNKATQSSIIDYMNLVFDYHGSTYPVYGFLPNRYTMRIDSSYNNAIYYTE